MYKTEWIIKDWNAEDFLFTYSEEEKQNNEINRENAKKIYSPEFIPFFCDEVKYFWLTHLEWLVYWFIRYYMKVWSWRFYFNSLQLWAIIWATEWTINNIVSKLSKLWILETSRKIKAWWWTLRFINKVNVKSDIILQWGLNSLSNELHIKKNKINKNKNILHQTEFDVIISSFWLSMLEIEQWFKFSKSSKHIIDCLSFIKECSAKLDILPIYNKDTINSTSILINKWYSIDQIVNIAQEDWRSNDCETYQEMIRNDYYLPSMY